MKPPALGQLNAVCEVCGDIGFKHLLVRCRDCTCSAAHQYCLDKVVFDASLADWFCYECLQRRGEVTCSRSLEKESSDGCEKLFSCAGVKNTPSVQERSAVFLDSASSYQHGTAESSESTKRFDECKKGFSCNGGEIVKTATTSSSSEESGQNIPSERESLESDDLRAPPGVNYILSRRSYLSEAQKDRVVALIQEIKPDITVFVAIMRKSHVQPPCAFMAISTDYASAHFPHESTNVTLERPGKSKKWHPKFYKRKDISMYMLRGQWLDFVQDNHVQEGDICLLFPTKGGRKLSFTVHLLRATAAHSRGGTGFQSVTSCPGDDIPSERESLESDDLRAPPGVNYILSRRSYLSEAQKDRVVALIQEIKPDITVFVAIMRKSHVQPPCAFMAISTDYASAHFPHESTNVTLERPGKSKKWHPKFYKRKDISMYMLRGQWLDFVQDNHVQEGDICLLFPTKGGRKLSFTVHLLRATAAHSRGGTGFQSVTSCPGDDIPSERESLELDDLRAPPGVNYILSLRSYLSEAQKDRVIALIQEIKPDITVFVAIMRKSHVQPPCAFLAISSDYASAHFPHESTNVTLERPGRSKKWHPKFYERKDRSSYVLRGQWLDFVQDNHVQEGDICLLFPTKGGRKLSFTVHLLRATAAHSRGGTGFQSVSSCHGVYIPPESDALGISTEFMEDSGDPSKPSYIVSFKSHLSQSQKKIVEGKVRVIQSEVPIYVAIMKKSNVTRPCELELGGRYAAANLPDRRQSVEIHCTGKTWKSQMVVRKGGRWYLCGGWSKFVRDNSLRVGDVCLFELKKNGRELTMMVHIIFREQFSFVAEENCARRVPKH